MSMIGYIMPCSSYQTWTRRRASWREMAQIGSLSACMRGETSEEIWWPGARVGCGSGEAWGMEPWVGALGSSSGSGSGSSSSGPVIPMVCRLVRATPRLKTLDVGPWKGGYFVEALGGGGGGRGVWLW